MSIIHVQQIAANLRTRFESLIDMSDVKQKDLEQRDAKMLSRALAAFAIAALAKTSDANASYSVTDEYGDDGIDGFYFSPLDHTCYLVQSKWSKDGNGAIDLAGCLKFVHGVTHLIEGRIDALGPRMQAKAADINAVLSDSEMSFKLVIAYSTKQNIAPDVMAPVQDLVASLNDGEDLVSLTVLRQQELIDVVRQRAFGESINFNVLLREWGKVSEPYKSFYGYLEIADIVSWGKYGEYLYHKNIRGFKGSTDVNDAIVATARDRPEDFLYLNNGITLLCEKVVKQPLGGSSRTSGVFECENVSVVNGAQTVGSIISALSGPAAASTARVMVRLISLESCPPDFGSELTRATNTQNRIEKRDFAALDPQQLRLKSDMFLSLQKEYVYKAGEQAPKPEKGCTLDEATVALACEKSDIAFCMTAKREVGKLYEDVKTGPYIALFNSGLTALRMWRCVQVMRKVDVALRSNQDDLEGKERLVAIHGNRFMLYLIFRKLGANAFSESISDFELTDTLNSLTPLLLGQVNATIIEDFPTAYPASLFKNATKCKQIAESVIAGWIQPKG